MDENEQLNSEQTPNGHHPSDSPNGEAIEHNSENNELSVLGKTSNDGGILTLSGEFVEDEFAAATINHNFLMDKIDILLEKLKLDA